MSEKYKTTCKYLNYVEHMLTLPWALNDSYISHDEFLLVSVNIVLKEYNEMK